MGDLVADAMLSRVKIRRQHRHPERRRLARLIDAGPISMGEVLNVLPLPEHAGDISGDRGRYRRGA